MEVSLFFFPPQIVLLQASFENETNRKPPSSPLALHFHLSVANETTATTPKTPSGSSYEDAEFAYEPFLDPHRDAALLDLLPDYLTEEICFPRSHAVKFYSKVGECMTKKVVMDEEESG